MEKIFFEGKHPLEELMDNYRNKARSYEEKGYKIPANFYIYAEKCVKECYAKIEKRNKYGYLW